MSAKSEMLERAAKSAYDRMVLQTKVQDGSIELDLWENQTESLREDWRNAMRCAIAELRIVSPEVFEAMCSANPPNGYHSSTHLGDIVMCEWVAGLNKVLEG